ncbi:MAG: ATP-binding protein [Dehalococcoidales bacterium]|nr:ATP-binding protein [Dehalococcoidales bacterium]
MLHSLNFRLMAAFTLIIMVIMGSAFFFAYRTAYRELSQVEVQLQVIQDKRVEVELVRLFQFMRSWEGVQPFVVQMGNLYGRHIIITDAEGIVVAASNEDLIGRRYEGDEPGTALSGTMGMGFGRMSTGSVGTLHILPGDAADINRAALEISYHTIGRFFLWGGAMAVAIALVLTFVLSRRILAPVRALTQAARRFGKGEFSRRVGYRGKGEMAELAQSFNSMAEDLEHTEHLRRNMVADIAHELRTPLSNLSGYLEAIGDGIVQPDDATIRSLSEEASSLSRLVDDLQELSLADTGSLKLVLQTADMAAIISETVTAIQAKAASRGLTVALDIADGLPPVTIDTHRIRQVLHNLLENAVIHTESGGSITVKAAREDGFIKVSVTDTGEGIPADDMPRIFERFYRVDKSRTRATGGPGLGLTIAKRLVEAHGGSITVESVPGQGAAFHFTIPVEKHND